MTTNQTETKETKTITSEQAIQTILNIMESNGYKETNGDWWLGPRLMDLYNFIRNHRDE